MLGFEDQYGETGNLGMMERGRHKWITSPDWSHLRRNENAREEKVRLRTRKNKRLNCRMSRY